jgi:type II secretory pathway pseudopilin PulG
MNKKAQFKMMETMLVLIIFFFLLAFAIGFYIKYANYDTKQKSAEAQQLVVIQMAQRVQYMPELQCVKFNGKEVVPDCIDIYKMKAFKAISKDNYRYNKLYPNILINVTQVYPDDFGSVDDTIYEDNPKNFTSRDVYMMPVTLYDPVTNSYGFGYTTVGIYS